MALATAPATCHRCKGPIQPGEDIRRYNRPAVGTLYHAACPTLAPATAAPPVAPPAPPSALDLDALAAALAARMAPPVAPATDSPASPAETIGCGNATCDDTCQDYSHNLVCDGYEDAGFDCPGWEWGAVQADASVTLDMRQGSFASAIEAMAASKLETSAYAQHTGNPCPEDEDWNNAFATACDGANADDTRAMLQYCDGMRAGLLLAARVIGAKIETPAPAKTRAQWVAGFASTGIPLALLVDEDATAAAMASEQSNAAIAAAMVACTCDVRTATDTTAPDDMGTIYAVGPHCAPLGATVGNPWNPKEHAL